LGGIQPAQQILVFTLPEINSGLKVAVSLPCFMEMRGARFGALNPSRERETEKDIVGSKRGISQRLMITKKVILKE
jgi:hypothetical protein